MWNSTNGERIFEAKWGLFSDGDVKPQFIYVDRSNKPKFGSALEGNASGYKNRVDWVGNISAGRFWFKLTNLVLRDTNKYVVGIVEEGKNKIIYSTILTVAGKYV